MEKKDRQHLINWAKHLLIIATNEDREIINTISCLKTTCSGIDMIAEKLIKKRKKATNGQRRK
jgi:hypothetical protein